MRVVVAGLGVQGQKRRRVAGTDFVAAVDPVNGEAKYRAIEDVPLNSYDAVLACIPDEPKIAVLDYLLGNGKHVLVEKPLWAPTRSRLRGSKPRRERTVPSATSPTITASSRTL